MPSPSTPRRTAIHRKGSTPPSKTKSIDVGVPLGIYDTNSVRDRIRQWQSQGGGVITAPDAYGEDDEEQKTVGDDDKSQGKDVDSASKSKGESTADCETTRKRNGGRRVKIDADGRARIRSGSAPAKRVVSDAHWRTNRSPPRSPPKSPTPSKIARAVPASQTLPDDGIRVKPIPDAKPNARRKKSDAKRTANRESVGNDDGIRVFSTPPGSCRQSGNSRTPRHDDMGSQSEKNSDAEIASSRSPISRAANPTQQLTPEKSPPLGSSAAKEKTRRRKSSRPKERYSDGEPPVVFPEARGSARSQKGNILSQVFGESRKMFSKPEPLPIPTPRVPSVEAWLYETSDPFLDDDEPCIENRAPSEPESRPQEEIVTEKIHVEDPNKIWDSLGPKEGVRVALHGSKRRKRIRSSAIYEDNPFPPDLVTASPLSSTANGTVSATKLVDFVQSSPEGSPSSLKRRGAKRTPSSPGRERKKSIIRSDLQAENVEPSVASSLLSDSSVEAPDPKFPLRPPGLNIKRPFPSTGQHRLSTIASVETFDTQAKNAPAPSISDISEATVQPATFGLDEIDGESRDKFDPSSLGRSKSHLTKHADLISVLSVPRGGSKSIVSARSIRTNRSRLATATIGDILKELATDEGKYMRELRTLVDGVIPVLLTCVLSKSDSAVAAGLFRPSANPNNDPNFTKPIVDMGIALERLKTLHKRIPMENVNTLLTWAQGAQRVYTEYLKAWRMGFQDVVVNLAPAAEDSSPDSKTSGTEPDGLDQGLPRNKDGDVVDGDGERVDVAFLLKRPLVRLKYLSKTLKGINFISPSPTAEALANKYQNLVIDARNRSNEERARLEDEAAASIDPTRARDPRTLAPLNGVTIDKTRHVRARDHFNLALPHSSGQCMDCRVELLLRDEANGRIGGDLLICEVDSTGRWLLFPPVQFGRVSARNGDLKGEVVVMIRGFGGNGKEWQELFYLRTDDEQTGFEWVQMLGLTPVPPKVMRSQSFVSRNSKKQFTVEPNSSALEPPAIASKPGKSRTPSPREVDIPIGEQANPKSKPWIEHAVEKELPVPPVAGDTVIIPPKLPNSPPSTPSKVSQTRVDEVNDLRSLPSQASSRRSDSHEKDPTPRSLVEALGSLMNTSPSALRRSKAKKLSKHADSSPVSPRSRPLSFSNDESLTPSIPTKETGDSESVTSQASNDHRSLSPEGVLDFSPSSRKSIIDQPKNSPRPSHHRSRSSVPSLELPTMPKIRKDIRPTTPIKEPDEELDWVAPAERVLSPTLSKDHKRHPSPLKTKTEDSSPPPTPPHSSPSPVQLKGFKTPVLPAKTSLNTKRRSSSPLKHEYEPSTASESSSDSETSTVEHNEATSVSDSSEDEDFEVEDVSIPLLPLGSVQPFSKASPQGSLYSLPNGTLSPSQSASQAPYKTVPPQPTKASKTIASIFSWSDKGAWQCLHPDECSIVITPGLIEAYEMSASHSKIIPLSSSTPVVDTDAFSDLASAIMTPDEVPNERPLVALELTPLVPLRRGTALDISIRSPPTANSQITSGSNIMFRSRSPEECEALYALINHSRINNPTYVALQNARGPYAAGSSFSSSIDRRTSTRASGSRTSSWFGSWGGSSGYRASSAPTPSIAPSESSIGSMASAFSALKRFGKGGGVFNIARSTISSRNGSGANSVYTSSDNSSGSGASSPIPPGGDASKVAPIGLSNAKIRLYIRETASRWRDMGSARLTIMRPSSPTLTPGGPSRASEKRIVINGKTKGEILLDVQLGESCFERVARTGIALSVWEDVVGPNGEVGVVGAVGGVGGGRARVYMIQMKSEAETAYTFSIVGKLRY
ncbi:hypothetical protein MMC07_008781 [Pseudocyphellaria aurata]|nr:hypothetical protein [Pseudocyphellaria aurata]